MVSLVFVQLSTIIAYMTDNGNLALHIIYISHLVTHLVWSHQLENSPGRPRARQISP